MKTIPATKKSLSVFLEKIIDYAGLFPPAKLNLENAFTNYTKYLSGDYCSILSRFICPVKQFPMLEQLITDSFRGTDNIRISALGQTAPTLSEFYRIFENELIQWKAFDNNLSIVKVNCYEIKLPGELSVGSSADIEAFLDGITNKIDSVISLPYMIFLEGDNGDHLNDNSSKLISAIADHNLKRNNSGFKLRTGGLTPEAFPTSSQIAHCIRTALDRSVPVKFTAGLHHPLRYYDDTVKTMMHGFFNIFAAGMIAYVHPISNDGLEEILNDEDASDFIFTDDSLSWKGWEVTCGQIAAARENLVLSYGSCSFEEPIEDLKALNLLK